MLTYIAVDLGYTWPWTHGHLVLALIAGSALLLFRNSPKYVVLPLLACTLWAFSAFLVVQFKLDMNAQLPMLTPNFLKTGVGRVLDVGAGSGRASLMVLSSRPQTTVTALDNFSAQYIQDNGPARFLANMRQMGFEKRVAVETGDMRKMPFESESFDGVVSTYAVDHVRPRSVVLHEICRVLRPQGQFLLVIVNIDGWVKFAYGPLMAMHGMGHPEDWQSELREAGFDVIEQGTRPATKYFLCRKR